MEKNKKLIFTLFIIFAFSKVNAFTVISKQRSETFTYKQLSKLVSIEIPMTYSRAYPGQLMTYRSIKLCDFFKAFRFSSKSTLEFIANDNFSVLIPASYVLSCDAKKSIAYLAIEPKSKWPLLKNHTNTTAGPYAVIWTDPHKSSISDEYWSWSVNKVIEHTEINESIVISAPQNVAEPNKKNILNGYEVFVSHCSSCHTINGIGKAVIGPDLSSPNNPLDFYPNIKRLKQFIRSPKSVRYFANSRMSGSSLAGLSEVDLNDLIAYFAYMKK